MNGASLTYGLLAEFAEADQLLAAARRVSQAGYRRIDGYTPFPIEGLGEALGFRKSWMSFVVLAGGITGCVSGYLLCYHCAAIAYPINVGGRPLNSWPAFIPVTFEMTILIAALSAFLGGASALTACRSRITRCSTSPSSPAPVKTVSFCASRRPIRSITQRRRGSFWKNWER